MLQQFKDAFKPKPKPPKANTSTTASPAVSPPKPNKNVNVLVIDGDTKHKWSDIFASATDEVEVVQTSWRDSTVR
jgi:hypothetical protein